MIVFFKLENILKAKGLAWKDLCDAGISVNMPQKFSKNRGVNTDTIDKVCSYLNVQPGDIMERIEPDDFEKVKLEREIESLKNKIGKLKNGN